MKIKYLIIVGVLCFLSNSIYANNILIHSNNVNFYCLNDNNNSPKNIIIDSKSFYDNKNLSVITGSCKINIYTELDNGTLIEGTVTITGEDMNFFKCVAIKFYGLFTSDY
tara:strand:+ start:439 stop:768 length:330 start_codon:yes stop_codon:yes gene_type:complete